MDTLWDVGKLLLAALFGFAGGQVSNKLERRRKRLEEAESLAADWKVEYFAGDN